MKDVNRVAIVVRPKEPFFDWLRAVEPEAPIDGLGSDEPGTVYLAKVGEIFDAERVVRRHFQAIFEAELDAWYRDPKTWPRRRSYAMFRKWFEVRLMETVFDLGR